ncbi:thiol reductant ABC exporter subunit CydC [Roseomonas gilardii]|uniref:Thiol reductant ABC exporter subunit CydC n=1 Tax=Roseomonas gilardii TaxID=257708 RepID=A0ABU3MIJ0_9PROT|nr:thiol reductant ABC exporter subunit CydC [Roseomonas gilardii]MDT8332722.1 thiol reductant ABC exporter subunit CydC [Roseomonas gilardii]
MWRDLARILGLWRAHRAGLALGALVACLAALSGVALLSLAGHGVSQGLRHGAMAAATGALLLLRPLILLRPVLRWMERMTTHAATFRALADTRVWFFRRLAERLPAGIGLRRAGDLLGRLVSDVEALDGLYLRAMAPMAAATATVLAIAALLGWASPGLMAVVALPLALALLLPPLLAPLAARRSAAVAEARGTLRARAVEPLLGLEDVLSNNGEARAGARLAEAGQAQSLAEGRASRIGTLGGAAGALLAQAALLGALAWGLAGGAGAAALAVPALFLALAAAESLAALPRAGIALAGAGAAARRLLEAADAPVPAHDPAAPAPLPPGHAIRMRDIRFAWEAEREPVLDGFSLEIPEGARVVLLGPSGAGKSTVAALLLGLARPQSGSITLGGVEIAGLSAHDLRRRITCLTQDARLFDDTIAANLRLARPEASEAELWQALDRARIGDLVRALPEGLETRCGEAGARFSGGQARRLTLARALLSPAPVLILDEPAAGLDVSAERAFLETLDEATAGRTVLLITHRLTGAEHPTRVLRLAGGRAFHAAG